MQVYITKMPQPPQDGASKAVPSEYYPDIERTAKQIDAYQPLLQLCSEARAAMGAAEVFEVTITPQATPYIR
jgi:hypothetical protein